MNHPANQLSSFKNNEKCSHQPCSPQCPSCEQPSMWAGDTDQSQYETWQYPAEYCCNWSGSSRMLPCSAPCPPYAAELSQLSQWFSCSGEYGLVPACPGRSQSLCPPQAECWRQEHARSQTTPQHGHLIEESQDEHNDATWFRLWHAIPHEAIQPDRVIWTFTGKCIDKKDCTFQRLFHDNLHNAYVRAVHLLDLTS